jgi:hypothetical protein
MWFPMHIIAPPVRRAVSTMLRTMASISAGVLRVSTRLSPSPASKQSLYRRAMAL